MKKVGHAGTLDPLATGILIVALGGATKLLQFLLGCDKEYEVLARFGAITESYDADSPPQKISDEIFSEDQVKKAMLDFSGTIEQIPPKYSALKIGGRRAADIMRSGGDVIMKPRNVTIFDFKLTSFRWPEAKFIVKCSSGTYIRSLINDLGQKLGCGAYVAELRRLKIKDFDVFDAKLVADLSPDDLIPSEEVAKNLPL